MINFIVIKYRPFKYNYMYLNGFFIFFTLLLTVPNYSYSEESNSNLFYLCKRDKQTRWLRAYKLDNGKCQTLYSKEGYLQVISSASYFSMCEGVLHSVQKNLEEGGFSCVVSAKYSVIDLD